MRDIIISGLPYISEKAKETQISKEEIYEKLEEKADRLLSSKDPNGWISAPGASKKDYEDYYTEEWCFGKVKYAPIQLYCKGIPLIEFDKFYDEEWGLWLQGDRLNELIETSKKNKQYVKEAITETEIEEGDTDSEKVEKLLSYLAVNTHYFEKDSTIEGLYKNHKANCSGYAEFFYDACLLEGIPCQVIIGDACHNDGETELHAWNRVYIKEEQIWYYVDPCWADGGDTVNENYSMSGRLWDNHVIKKIL